MPIDWTANKQTLLMENCPATFEGFLNECQVKRRWILKEIPLSLWGNTSYSKSDISQLYQSYLNYKENTLGVFTYYDQLYEWLRPKPDIFLGRLSALEQTIHAEIMQDLTQAIVLICQPGYELTQEDNDYLEDACIVCGYTERCRYIDKLGCQCVEFTCNQTAEITDKIYPEYQGTPINPGYVWHICRKDIYERKIKKTGLIPKSKGKYGRHYAPRIYVFINKPTKGNIMATITQFIKSVPDISDKTLPLYNDWCLLKIDLSNGPQYRFFEDSEYILRGNTAAFTYENINPDSISLDSEFSVNAAEIFSNKISAIQK